MVASISGHAMGSNSSRVVSELEGKGVRAAAFKADQGSARCAALLATCSLITRCSKLWLGHAGESRRALSSMSNRQRGGYAMPNRMRAIARKPRSTGGLCTRRIVSDSPRTSMKWGMIRSTVGFPRTIASVMPCPACAIITPTVGDEESY